MLRTDDFEQVAVRSDAELHRWLATHHAQDRAVWLVTTKAGHPGYVDRDTVLDALVIWGWTDGVRRKRDDHLTMQLIAPRRQQVWAETYRIRHARLLAEGRMQPPGIACAEQAQRQGTWDAHADVDALLIPDDLAQALRDIGGAVWFGAAAPSYRRNVLRWIAIAKRSPTRAARVAEVATRAAQGEKVPQF